MNPKTIPRRSALYLPASNARAIEKARTVACDVVIIDLEDAVAPEAKQAAREAAVAAARQGDFGHRELVIRANGKDTPWGSDDLAAIAASGADAVLVPKVSSARDIAQYDEALAAAAPQMQLWAMIETCASLFALAEIAACASSTRLAGFVLGTNDLAKEMRARIAPGRASFLPFLAQTVAAARAHGLLVLDGVCNEFRDLEAFAREAQQGRDFGFDGKTLIHPAQIEPCNAAFSPSQEELSFAQAIVAAFDRPENAGRGAVQVEGRMVELLHREEAERTIALAEAISGRGA